MASQNFRQRNRQSSASNAPRESAGALFGDYLYGDRESLRRYRDFARDEHRRFGADYERSHGTLGRAESLTEYDRIDAGRNVDDRARDYVAQRGHDTVPYDDQSKYRPALRRARSEQHAGRGPRGYQRPDQSIYEDVCERLTEDHRIDASDVEVTVTNGEVTLTGTLRSRTAKRRATYVVDGVRGVKDVHNNIRVSDEQHGIRERT
jgi:osmotically-inducible protein OsmY